MIGCSSGGVGSWEVEASVVGAVEWVREKQRASEVGQNVK